MIKIQWNLEEALILVDIYHKKYDKSSDDISSALGELSELLNKRAVILGINHDEKFRNLNGMTLMYQNVAFIVSGGNTGMSAASRVLYVAEDLFQTKRDAFLMLVDEFYLRYS